MAKEKFQQPVLRLLVSKTKSWCIKQVSIINTKTGYKEVMKKSALPHNMEEMMDLNNKLRSKFWDLIDIRA